MEPAAIGAHHRGGAVPSPSGARAKRPLLLSPLLQGGATGECVCGVLAAA